MIAQRHMHLYGTTPEQLAEIAVAVRHHASMNPDALFRDEVTVEDVMRSRVISSPLRLNDCCVITDGGGAVVVASPEVARNCRHTPVWCWEPARRWRIRARASATSSTSPPSRATNPPSPCPASPTTT